MMKPQHVMLSSCSLLSLLLLRSLLCNGFMVVVQHPAKIHSSRQQQRQSPVLDEQQHATSSSSLLRQMSTTSTASSSSVVASDEKASSTKKGGDSVKEKGEEDHHLSDRSSVAEIKMELLDLLPHMTGQQDEFRRVEELVNALEKQYVPVQTLGFLNLAMEGTWQLLFSTNLSGTPSPQKFRFCKLTQTINCQQMEGILTNTAKWDLAEKEIGQFDISGTFSVTCKYTINQGSRMVLELQDHILQPSPGSPVPHDVQYLVGLLHRSMPKEMFDPTNHATDITYLDADLRIVRYTGTRYEGVRDIFLREEKSSSLLETTRRPPAEPKEQ